MRRIKVLDTTMRDGEQSPGIALRPESEGEIALMLERLGVDVIEAAAAAVGRAPRLRVHQIIDPADLGAAVSLPLGKHSGRHAFTRACAEAARRFDRDQLDAAFGRFKRLADRGTHVSLDDVFTEVPA